MHAAQVLVCARVRARVWVCARVRACVFDCVVCAFVDQDQIHCNAHKEVRVDLSNRCGLQLDLRRCVG